jgi:ABC-type phosphate/phosphonate transport system permease subunit
MEGMRAIAQIAIFLVCMFQSFPDGTRARVIALGMYPPGMKNRAVCESNKSRDHPERDGLAVTARSRLTRDPPTALPVLRVKPV